MTTKCEKKLKFGCIHLCYCHFKFDDIANFSENFCSAVSDSVFLALFQMENVTVCDVIIRTNMSPIQSQIVHN